MIEKGEIHCCPVYIYAVCELLFISKCTLLTICLYGWIADAWDSLSAIQHLFENEKNENQSNQI